MTSRRALRFLLTSAGVTLAGLALAPAALAVSFDVYNGPDSHSKGGSHAYGDMAFSGNAVHITGIVNDVCPGDSHRATVKFTVITADGLRQAPVRYADFGGCTGDKNAFDFSRNYGKRIKSVEVVAYKINGDDENDANEDLHRTPPKAIQVVNRPLDA